MPSDPESFVGRLVWTCIGLLVTAVAIYTAVNLIMAIWTTLLVILGVSLLVAVLVATWRQRNRGW